ncbi:MarR family winged helix-turn-helix transcriptional regulator [Variovorax sp. VNK109]|uniref:MarR family winged helix-turn-helix transcriptional regulator n=1 Tax=Variovorax sp. VNK109 TaxID=3400919 RepID=UPI003BFD3200
MPKETPSVDKVDISYLENLVGYNARRVSLSLIDVFVQRMAELSLHPVEFSVLMLITRNPGITSSQLCAALGMKAPNLVGMIGALEKRELVMRKPHPQDGRAMGVHLTPAGRKFMARAEKISDDMEAQIAQKLPSTERATLVRLLQKLYLD